MLMQLLEGLALVLGIMFDKKWLFSLKVSFVATVYMPLLPNTHLLRSDTIPVTFTLLRCQGQSSCEYETGQVSLAWFTAMLCSPPD